MKSVFDSLNAINVNDKVEKKSNLTYLSWAWAWAEVKKVYPDASYDVITDPTTHKPYFYDENLGYMVMTTVTISGQSLDMWLPVMDGANQAMKSHSYEYSTRYGVKTVDSATMFDINKTLMRCLTKNLAMFGLGLYIYAGEDLPEAREVKVVAPKKTKKEAVAKGELLVLGDANWEKVKSYAEANKANGFEAIIGQLLRKYVIDGDVIEEIKKIVG